MANYSDLSEAAQTRARRAAFAALLRGVFDGQLYSGNPRTLDELEAMAAAAAERASYPDPEGVRG
jgi:hypothetical protein